MIDHFSKEVLKASPIAGPIVNFLLKNALSYGSFELRKKYMNWPFETVSPLMFENFKIGLSFVF